MCLKVCSKCKEQKDLSEFNNRAKSKDGLNHICRLCISKRRKELREDTVLRLKTQLRSIGLIEFRAMSEEEHSLILLENDIKSKEKYAKENREKVLASKKKWRDKNKEKVIAYRESIKEKRKEYDRKRYLEKKEYLDGTK